MPPQIFSLKVNIIYMVLYWVCSWKRCLTMKKGRKTTFHSAFLGAVIATNSFQPSAVTNMNQSPYLQIDLILDPQLIVWLHAFLYPVCLIRESSLNTLLQLICPKLGGRLWMPSVGILTWVTSMEEKRREFRLITCWSKGTNFQVEGE